MTGSISLCRRAAMPPYRCAAVPFSRRAAMSPYRWHNGYLPFHLHLPKCALILCALHYQKLVTAYVISIPGNQTFTEMTDGIQSQMTD